MSKPILILYGSVTGNGEICAERAASFSRERGYDPSIENMADADPVSLTLFPNILLITSTFGDGDPPDGCEDYHDKVVKNLQAGNPAFDLSGRGFSVLALGDKVYDLFCKCGIDYDEALEKLGAVRLHPRIDCDCDYDDECEAWLKGVFNALAEDRAGLVQVHSNA